MNAVDSSGPSNANGTARSSDWDKVFVLNPDGSYIPYASGLPRTHTGSFDWGFGDYILGTYDAVGTLLRLRDIDGSGQIDAAGELSSSA